MTFSFEQAISTTRIKHVCPEARQGIKSYRYIAPFKFVRNCAFQFQRSRFFCFILVWNSWAKWMYSACYWKKMFPSEKFPRGITCQTSWRHDTQKFGSEISFKVFVVLKQGKIIVAFVVACISFWVCFVELILVEVFSWKRWYMLDRIGDNSLGVER